MNDVIVASQVGLWALVLILLVGFLGLARQVAILTARTGGDAPVEFPGPELGSTAPDITGEAADGRPINLAPGSFTSSTALVFMSDNCSTCEQLLPELLDLSNELAPERMHIVLEATPMTHVFSGSLAGRVIVSPEAFRAWGVSRVPYAFTVEAHGRLAAKGDLSNLGRLRDALGIAMPDAASATRAG